MTRARQARVVAAAAFAVTLVCAWLLLPAHVDVDLGETAWTLDRWQYVLGAGLVGWALAAGAGGTGLGLVSLARTFRSGDGSGATRPTTRPGRPGDPTCLGTWFEAAVFLSATVVVWVQVALAGPGRG